jgi:hypothetical protein
MVFFVFVDPIIITDWFSYCLLAILLSYLPYTKLTLESQFSLDLFDWELGDFVWGRNLIRDLRLTCLLHEDRSGHFFISVVQLGVPDFRYLERRWTPISWTFTSCSVEK